MALLEKHLQEIQLCSSTISDLSFHPPRRFTNALLHTQDITALIRDTEPHEQHLFSLAAAGSAADPTSARELQHNPGDVFKGPRKNTAVAAVLGSGMADKLRLERSKRGRGGQVADIDVELLLNGAEKLRAVYAMPGAAAKIASLRNRHDKALASIQYYEGLVAEQTALLKQMNRPISRDSLYDDEVEDVASEPAAKQQLDASSAADDFPMTEEDLLREEESIRELQRKKQALEERVMGMEKDLGGILG